MYKESQCLPSVTCWVYCCAVQLSVICTVCWLDATKTAGINIHYWNIARLWPSVIILHEMWVQISHTLQFTQCLLTTLALCSGSQKKAHFVLSSPVLLWLTYVSWPLFFQLSSSIAWLCSLCLTLNLKSTTTILLMQMEMKPTSKLLFIFCLQSTIFTLFIHAYTVTNLSEWFFVKAIQCFSLNFFICVYKFTSTWAQTRACMADGTTQEFLFTSWKIKCSCLKGERCKMQSCMRKKWFCHYANWTHVLVSASRIMMMMVRWMI